jgi:hypothetical protein
MCLTRIKCESNLSPSRIAVTTVLFGILMERPTLLASPWAF